MFFNYFFIFVNSSSLDLLRIFRLKYTLKILVGKALGVRTVKIYVNYYFISLFSWGTCEKSLNMCVVQYSEALVLCNFTSGVCCWWSPLVSLIWWVIMWMAMAWGSPWWVEAAVVIKIGRVRVNTKHLLSRVALRVTPSTDSFRKKAKLIIFV